MHNNFGRRFAEVFSLEQCKGINFNMFSFYVIFVRISWLFFVFFPFGVPKVQRNVNLVDPEKCCKMSIWLQKSVLIQPRTSLGKSAVSWLHQQETAAPSSPPSEETPVRNGDAEPRREAVAVVSFRDSRFGS